MADQELGLILKTKSDVPEAMGKASRAVVSFAKQTEDIQRKFSTAFKDIALSFVAPLVIFNSVVNSISASIAQAKQDAKDALDFAAKGESKFLSETTTASAREAKRANQEALDIKNAKLAKQAIAEAHMENDSGFLGFGGEADKALRQFEKEGEGKGFLENMRRGLKTSMMFFGISSMSKDSEMQDLLTRRALDRSPNIARPEDNTKKIAEATKELTELRQFANRSKPGEISGYGNVIGVGSNIAIEMAQMQIDELKRHTELLQMIATKESVAAVDFSKGDKSTAAPSRAKLLSGK